MNRNHSERTRDLQSLESLSEEERDAVESIALLMGIKPNTKRANHQTKTIKIPKPKQPVCLPNEKNHFQIKSKSFEKKGTQIPHSQNDVGQKKMFHCDFRVPKKLMKSFQSTYSPKTYPKESGMHIKNTERQPILRSNLAGKIPQSKNQQKILQTNNKINAFGKFSLNNFALTDKKDSIYLLRKKVDNFFNASAEHMKCLSIPEKRILSEFTAGLNATIAKKQKNKVDKTVNGTKKENHLESEHTRRDAINMGIDILSKLLPNESNKSKMMVIFNAIFYILELKIESKKRN